MHKIQYGLSDGEELCPQPYGGHTHTHTFITAQIFVANLSLSLFWRKGQHPVSALISLQ